jgi:hypothetical protein
MLTAHQLFLTNDLLRRYPSLTFEEARQQALSSEQPVWYPRYESPVGHLTDMEGASMSKKKRAQLRVGISVATTTNIPAIAPVAAHTPSNGDMDLSTAVYVAIQRALLGDRSQRPLTRSLRQAAHDNDKE